MPSTARFYFTENVHALELPPGHRFPIGKYEKILQGVRRTCPGVLDCGLPASPQEVLLAHTNDYVERVRSGTLSATQVRRLGLPWSESLVTRAFRSVGGTLSATVWALHHRVGAHLAGGTHHAFADRGEGFCVFNDIAVSVRYAQRYLNVGRVAILDLDVHQGNGTASIFAGDTTVLTTSVHGERNYPFVKETSSFDYPLPDRAIDYEYLNAIQQALEQVRLFRPELLFFQAGVDVLEGDRLGKLAVSQRGLSQRNRAVYAFAQEENLPLVVTLGGGYHRDIDESVKAHVTVYRELFEAFEKTGVRRGYET
jgi:acetoin utilization deacetylase AcuC-like enzyme